MNIEEYKKKVIDLFKSGKATDKQWEELGVAMLWASESAPEMIDEIDKAIDPDYFEMETCGNCGYRNPKNSRICENCGEE